jgi:hypothetical protein
MMKYQRILPILLALASGLIVGRMTAPAAKVSPESNERRTQTVPRSGFTASQGGEGAELRSQSQVRDEKRPSPDRGKRISVPLNLIVKDLKERQLADQNFDRIGDNIDGALTMLDATDSERQKVKAVLAKAEKDILAAEKERLKVTRSDSTGVELDTSGMKEVLPGIISAAQSGIRDSLAQDIGEALNASISWDRFYSRTDEFTPFTLSIERFPGGQLVAQAKRDNSSMGMGIEPKDIPADGSPIPVSRFFDDRWRPFLKDVELVPVDPEQQTH